MKLYLNFGIGESVECLAVTNWNVIFFLKEGSHYLGTSLWKTGISFLFFFLVISKRARKLKFMHIFEILATNLNILKEHMALDCTSLEAKQNTSVD